MYLNVPTNWDDRVVDRIMEINESPKYKYKVKQVYGAVLTKIGTGRMDTPQKSGDVLINHINKIKQLGIMFNYLINAPSLGGIEHDKRYRKEILDTLSWINDLGVDIVTVSIPFLGELINRYFPNLKIKISVIADVRTVQGIKLLEKLGPKIYSVTISRFINREFNLLKEIKKAAPFEIELIANSNCLYNCPYQKYHGDLTCWFSKLDKGWEQPFVDYRPLSCDEIRLTDTSEVIKAPWIRPEDLHVYEDLGISSIKLAGRTFPTNELLRIVEAYASGYYEGNLWDLISPNLPIYVNNRDLDGFINYFIKGNTNCNIGCKECKYCDNVGSKCIKLRADSEKFLDDLRRRLEARIDHTIKLKPYFPESR